MQDMFILFASLAVAQQGMQHTLPGVQVSQQQLAQGCRSHHVLPSHPAAFSPSCCNLHAIVYCVHQLMIIEKKQPGFLWTQWEHFAAASGYPLRHLALDPLPDNTCFRQVTSPCAPTTDEEWKPAGAALMSDGFHQVDYL